MSRKKYGYDGNIMSIGKRLREWGKKEFKTMTKFAEKLNIDYTTLYRYINDKRKPTMEVLLKLNEMGCDLSWLLTGEVADDPKQIIKIIKNYSQEEYPYVRKIRSLEMENKKLEEENRKLREEIEKLEKLLNAFLEYKKSKTT